MSLQRTGAESSEQEELGRKKEGALAWQEDWGGLALWCRSCVAVRAERAVRTTL
jgi:hypothetical protein